MRLHAQHLDSASRMSADSMPSMARSRNGAGQRGLFESTRGPFGWPGEGSRMPVVQAKLKVNAPGDRYEQEADRVAESVIGGSRVNPAAISNVSGGGVQRNCSCGGSGECDECKKKKEEGMIQRTSLDASMPEVADPVSAAVRGSGRAMGRETRGFFEDKMGTSFEHVRIHTDSAAADSARAINARAYTTGRDIVFGAGEYRPETESGKRLIAHELVHVVQQGGRQAGPARSARETTPESGTRRFALGPSLEQEPPALEHQADTMADRVMGPGLTQNDRSSIQSRSASLSMLQRTRIPLPTPVPLCGQQVTHIDVEEFRWKDLEGAQCIPRGVQVYRMNVVGRQVSPVTTGLGRIVFNLHIGYYIDPVTGDYCAVVDDSKNCICSRCAFHLCTSSVKEALEAAYEFAKKVLLVLGVVVLALILAAILAEIIAAIIGAVGAVGLLFADNHGPSKEKGAVTADESSQTA